MQNQELILSIIDEIVAALQNEYLSQPQVDLILARKNEELKYQELISKSKISEKCALVHCLVRTSKLMYWNHGMEGDGTSYLSDYDNYIFLEISLFFLRKRLKVLEKKGKLPLIPENIKLPHLTDCVTFSATGHLFRHLIILPNKKTM